MNPKVAEITFLLTNTSYSQRDISKRCDVSRVFVQNIKKKLANMESLTPKRIRRCGKKKMLTPKTDICIQ